MPESKLARNLTRSFSAPLLSVLTMAGSVWFLVGSFLRLSGLRDRFDGFSVIYYTTPWLVTAAGMAALGFHARRTRRNRSAGFYNILAAGAVIAWLWTSWYSAAPVAAKPDFRVLLWNVRNNEADFDDIAARIREFSPDVVALAEAGKRRNSIDFWRAAFPDYSVERLPQHMLTMSRKNLQHQKSGVLAPGSFFGAHTSQIGSRDLMIVQADIDARPLRSRRKALEELTTYVREHAGKPLILLGDFNTPRQSWHLDPMRSMLKHAFETRGSGLADTWPIPFPVLSLDQVWVSPELEVVSCRQGWSLMSDHRPVFVELRYRD